MDFTTCSAEISSSAGVYDISSGTSTKISTLFLFLLGFQDASTVITNVSVIQSWRWFFHLSAFESVFLAFIIAQIGALSLLGILPVNLTEFWQGNPAGRRKKRRAESQYTPQPPPHVAQAAKDIGLKLLILYKKLDQNQCGFRALCELQSKVISGDYDKRQLPEATQLVLTTFLSYAEQPFMKTESRNEEEREGNTSVDIHPAVQPYAEAIKIGCQPQTFYTQVYSNATNKETEAYENACHSKYPVCPVTSDELMEYIERINVLEY